jgi:hypothetical protein
VSFEPVGLVGEDLGQPAHCNITAVAPIGHRAQGQQVVLHYALREEHVVVAIELHPLQARVDHMSEVFGGLVRSVTPHTP